MIIDYSNADKIDELGTVWINGEEFKGIGYNGLLTVNTKTYVSEPTRANDGSMPNIGDHETFIVPRCKINFKYLNINDYRRLCNAILPNEFLVRYYDKDFGDFVEHWMYCEPQEMTKIYNIGTAVIGVLDYEVSFIGTLNKLKELTVEYDMSQDTLMDYRGDFSYIANYSLGDRVSYGGDYYEAIYYVDNFTGYAPPNSTYWSLISSPTLWMTTRYSIGKIVFTTTTNSSGTTYSYFECIKDNTGASVKDREYWKPVEIKAYNENTTYHRGEYVWLNNEGSSGLYYKAIYFRNTFSGQYTYNNEYWKKLSVLSPIAVNWGQSLILADTMELFVPPEGKTSADKWQVYIKKSSGEFEATSNFYYANQSISVLRDMKLKPVWE